MKAYQLFRGLVLGFFMSSMLLMNAMADPPGKGVPTKVVPKKAPPKRTAAPPRAAKTPPVTAKAPPETTTTCEWVDDADVTTVTQFPQTRYIQGHTIDPYCGPEIELPGYLSTAPVTPSTIHIVGKTFVCGPRP